MTREHDQPDVKTTTSDKDVKTTTSDKDTIKKLEDNIVRLRADIANMELSYSKRIGAQYYNSMATILKSLIGVFDACEIGAKTNPALTVIWELVKSELSKKGVEIFKPEVGVAFDSNFHEVIDTEQGDKSKNNTIARVALSGYQLVGGPQAELLRAARVVIVSN